MRKKIFILLVIFTNISYFCFAQDKGNKAEEILVDYFTKELSLTPDESTKLWPVFNNYRNEIAAIRKDNRNDQLQMDEKIVNVRKKYKTGFKAILGNDDRVNNLFVAEKKFNDILLDELKRRKNGE